MIKKYKFSYAKLVRDNIPELVKKDGGMVKKKILGHKAYVEELKKKLLEEGRELFLAKADLDILSELADVQEVIDALLSALGLSGFELKKLQAKKRKKAGAFKKKIYIHHIETGPKFDPIWLKYYLKNSKKFPQLK